MMHVFRDIAAANPVLTNHFQNNTALGVLNALVFVNLPYLNICVIPFVRDRLGMIGSLQGFLPFLVQPHISGDGSDHHGGDI